MYSSITIANINAEVDNTPEILITVVNNTGRAANLHTQNENGDYYDATEVGNFTEISTNSLM